MRKNRHTCYFGSQAKAGAPGTVEDYLIDLRDEGED